MQPGPVSDSSNRDAFEAVVELYYQTNGYITSSGKRFRVWEAGEKKRRGFQEIIDVLAISDRETVIVRVSSNLDDPLRFGEHPLDIAAKLNLTKAYFERVTQYLKSVEQYAWMVAEGEAR